MAINAQAAANILRKRVAVDKVLGQRLKYMETSLTKERAATNQLEDVVTSLIIREEVSQTEAAKILGVSRDKVRGMMQRANKRNMTKLKAGHDD